MTYIGERRKCGQIDVRIKANLKGKNNKMILRIRTFRQKKIF